MRNDMIPVKRHVRYRETANISAPSHDFRILTFDERVDGNEDEHLCDAIAVARWDAKRY